MDDIIVVGIGNPYRGDDAAGWAVIDGLMETAGSAIKLVKERGDIAELIEIFDHHKTVYLVDACQSGAPVGTWQRIDAHNQPIMDENPQTSTHGFSVSQAISLAKNLDQLPNKLILYLINGENYSVSEALSPSVAKSVDGVIKALLNEEDIQSCMNTA
jgi:hydrogenase maturation protease